MSSKPMKEYCGREIQPGKEYKSDKELLNFIRENSETAYHPVGTCKMGTDEFSVI